VQQVCKKLKLRAPRGVKSCLHLSEERQGRENAKSNSVPVGAENEDVDACIECGLREHEITDGTERHCQHNSVCLGCGNPLLLLLLFSNCHLDSLHKESTTSVLKTGNYEWSASAKTNAKALALHSQFLTQICQSLSQDDYYLLWIHDDGE